MSENNNVGKTFDDKIDAAIQRHDAEQVWAVLFIDWIKERVGNGRMFQLTDGETTIQCLINNPAREKHKRTKN